MRTLMLLLLAATISGCATRPAGPSLRLVGTEPSWGGTLTPEMLRIEAGERAPVIVRSVGPWPAGCGEGEKVTACFFGDHRGAGPKYVNARLPNGQALSVVVDPGGCRIGGSK